MCDKCGEPGGEKYSFYHGIERQTGKTVARRIVGQASAVLCGKCLAKHRWASFATEGLLGTAFGVAVFLGGIYGFNWLTFDLGVEGLIGRALKFVGICVIGTGLLLLINSVRSFFSWLFAGADKAGPSLDIALRRKELEAGGSNAFWATLPEGTRFPS